MMRVPSILLLVLALALQVVGSEAACGSSGPQRRVRFWVGGNQVNPSSPPLNGTAGAGSSCKPYLLGNLTRYQQSISSIGKPSGSRCLAPTCHMQPPHTHTTT